MGEKIVCLVFDCPVHGREIEVFCFRAYEMKDEKRFSMLEGEIRPLNEDERRLLERFFK